MAESAHLIVEEGPAKGTEITVAPGMGLRLGRATGNDVAIPDPSVSRFHCRVFIRQDEGLWIADLGSANQTLVNDKAVHEQKLHARDRIMIGDTVIKVTSDGAAEAATPAAAATAAVPSAAPGTVTIAPPTAPAPEQSPEATQPAPSGPVVDLGLNSTSPKGTGRQKGSRRLLIIGIVTAVLCGLIALLIVFFPVSVITGNNGSTEAQDFMPGNFELKYEKVVGSSEDVFWLSLTVDNETADLELHDLKGTHFSESGRQVDPEAIDTLASNLEKALFFSLKEKYTGRARKNVHELSDLTVTIGTKTHRTRVLNTPVPDFDDVSRIVRAFSRVQFPECRHFDISKEQLISMSEEQWLTGQKLYEEKNVLRKNLALAVSALKDSENLVDSLDPKPDFYKDVVALRRQCEIEHKDACDALRFDSDRAMRLDDWQSSAVNLRKLLDTIHNNKDPRFKQAEQDLIHVEDRLNSKG